MPSGPGRLERAPELEMVRRVACLALLALLRPASALNLDLASAVLLNGTDGTNFGYSVALWYHAPQKYQRLVVGSPLYVGTQRGEGGVCFCHPHTGLCRVDPQATRSLQGHDTNELSQVDENLRADMGFGETIASLPTSPHLLVCAPRYPFHQSAEKKFEGILPRGACLKLGPGPPQPLVPVTELYTLARTPEGKTVKRINTIRHTGFSVAGFSAVIAQNDQYYIGGPMAFYGRGTAFWKSGAHYRFLPIEINRDVDKDFSLGFWAVAAAKLDGSGEYLAVTAPNDLDARGSVSLYSVKTTGLSLRRPRSGVSLVGAESGGMYGYSITAGDWDGDGIDDLAVGAPFTGAAGVRPADSGSVHVVYGPMLDAVERPAQWLRGEVPSAHLGLAVAGAGDLDRDGRDDLAVAAPDDDHGKVFIYNGGPDGLHLTPSQVLSGRDLLRPVALRPARFGFSIAGGQDIDDNGCPDLLVGAVGVDRAVYIRTAPVLTVVGKLEFDPGVVALRSRLCNTTSPNAGTESFTCFELKVTLQYNSSVYVDNVDVDLSLSVDERYPFLRSLFWDSGERRVLSSLQLPHVSRPPSAYSALVYIKSERPSLQELVRASLNISLSDVGTRAGAPDTEGPVPPILQSAMLEATTRLTCHDEDSCFTRADLQLSVEYSPLRIGGGRQSMDVEVRVQKAQAHQVSLQVQVPSMLSFSHAVGSSLLPACSHAADDGRNFVQLTCSLAATINKDTTVAFTLYFDHSPLALLGAVEEGLVEMLPLFFSVQGDTEDATPADNHVHVLLDLVLSRDVLTAGLSQPEQVRVLLNETLSLESVLTVSAAANNYSLDQLGPEAVHIFTFTNRGPAPILHDQILVEWPRRAAAGGNLTLPLLYITDQVATSGPVVCRPLLPNELNFTSPDEIQDEMLDARYLGDGDVYIYNASDSHNTTDTLGREERSSGDDTDGGDASGRSGTVVPSIDCNSMDCFVINCSVSGLLAGDVAQVTVRSRVAVATLNKKYRNLMLTSRARLQSSSEVLEVTTYVTLILPPQGTLDLLSNRWWLPSVALLLGLLVLLLLAIGLYKCGFFRREKRRHLQQLRASQRQRSSQAQPLTKEQEQEQQQLFVHAALAQGEDGGLSPDI